MESVGVCKEQYIDIQISNTLIQYNLQPGPFSLTQSLQSNSSNPIMSSQLRELSACKSTWHKGVSLLLKVVTAADDSTIGVWDLETGAKSMMYTGAHGNEEITCLALDETGRRLFTGARNGTIKVGEHTWRNLLCLFLYVCVPPSVCNSLLYVYLICVCMKPGFSSVCLYSLNVSVCLRMFCMVFNFCLCLWISVYVVYVCVCLRISVFLYVSVFSPMYTRPLTPLN